MTSKYWRQVAVATLLMAGAVGCSGNGGLFRRSNRNDDCDTCHYGCCDMMGGMGGEMMMGDGGTGYGGGCSGGGCMSCGQAPDLMPIGSDMLGPGMMEQVPNRPFSAGGTTFQPGPVPGNLPTPVRPGPVGVE